MWQFPSTTAALALLSKPLSFPPPSPARLEAALHQPSSDAQFLADLHGRLLGLSIGASSAAKWMASTARFIRAHPDSFAHALQACDEFKNEDVQSDALPRFPTDEEAYARLSPTARLLVLHTITELVIAYHDTLLSAGNIGEYGVQQLRFAPIGTDVIGNVYWYFGDKERVYREPSKRAREQREKQLRDEQAAREKESERLVKAEKRKAAEKKREEQRIRREQRKKMHAEKWAPRVAASRVTRAAKRAEQNLLDQSTVEDRTSDMNDKRSSSRKRKPSVKTMDESTASTAEASSSHRGKRGSNASLTQDLRRKGNNSSEETSIRSLPNRRRKGHIEPISRTAAKRPRRSEVVFADPDLRVCKHWEVFTTDAASLCNVIQRFNMEQNSTIAEQALVQWLTEVLLPEIEQHEAQVKKETERKERALFLMMNQKRSSRVQAIAERKEIEARRAAQKEEEIRFEEERLTTHRAKVAVTMAAAECEQSRDIRQLRRQFGLLEAVARDEGKLTKLEPENRKQLSLATVRRSSRTTRGNRTAKEKYSSNISEDAQDKTKSEVTTDRKAFVDEVPSDVAGVATKDGHELLASMGEGRVSDQPEDSKNPATEEFSQHGRPVGTGSSTESTGDHLVSGNETRTSRKPLSISEEPPAAESPHLTIGEDFQRLSGAPTEMSIGKEFQWEYNEDDKMPARVLDRFFFACRSDFNDAPLEECDSGGTDVIGLGILVPPSSSMPKVSRVEIPAVTEWVIEYGQNPKLWVKSRQAWYELRRPAVEYRDTFFTTRRKFELCARIAIIGETMRGPQLNYNSIVNFLSMRYGDMKSYKETDILEEKVFIVNQMESLNRRSLLQSGFLRSLQKRLRAEQRKAISVAEKLKTPLTVVKTEMKNATIDESPHVTRAVKSEGIEETRIEGKASQLPKAKAINKDEKLAITKRRRRPNSLKKAPVPRAVSSIITSLLNAATKSTKPARKRKRIKEEKGSHPKVSKMKRVKLDDSRKDVEKNDQVLQFLHDVVAVANNPVPPKPELNVNRVRKDDFGSRTSDIIGKALPPNARQGASDTVLAGGVTASNKPVSESEDAERLAHNEGFQNANGALKPSHVASLSKSGFQPVANGKTNGQRGHEGFEKSVTTNGTSRDLKK